MVMIELTQHLLGVLSNHILILVLLSPHLIIIIVLAQAEHDTEARPILVCTDATTIDKVNTEVIAQLNVLPTKDVAQEAVKKGFACLCPDMATAIRISDSIGPEHLEIITSNAEEVKAQCQSYGGVFIGQISAEVLGDYGAGPNHVLPTCGTSKYTGGLSVFTFLRIRTWMNITEGDSEEAQEMIRDCINLGRIEGLEGHARAAEKRLSSNKKQKLA